MTVLPLWLATALYLWQAWNFSGGMRVVFIGYSLANLGLIWAARG